MNGPSAESFSVTDVRAVALIPSELADRGRWLFIQRPAQRGLEMISATPLAGESGRESLLREVCFELGLAPRDLLVANMAQAQIQWRDASAIDSSPKGAEFYLVQIYRRGIRVQVDSLAHIHWVSNAEIAAGRTEAGVELSQELYDWIQAADLLTSWSSHADD